MSSKEPKSNLASAVSENVGAVGEVAGRQTLSLILLRQCMRQTYCLS